MNIFQEYKAYIYAILIILIFVWWAYPILIWKKESKIKHYISMNFLISWIVCIFFLFLMWISYFMWNKYYFFLFLLLGSLLTFLTSFIHFFVNRKKINNSTFRNLFYSDIWIIILIWIVLILFLIWYFKPFLATFSL